MYLFTAGTWEGLTLNAPYPSCQENPPGRTSFELLNGMSKRASRRQDKEQMNVVRRSARGDEREALAACNATQIGKKFGYAGGGNHGAAFPGAENAMNKIACIRVCHDASSLRDYHSIFAIPYPTLKRGANNHCANGAHLQPDRYYGYYGQKFSLIRILPSLPKTRRIGHSAFFGYRPYSPSTLLKIASTFPSCRM
jgi:hypothetical protein